MIDCPKTLIEAVRYFADLDVCHAYMASIKWPDGFAAFDALARKLVTVPKSQVDAKIAADKKARKKAKRKK